MFELFPCVWYARDLHRFWHSETAIIKEPLQYWNKSWIELTWKTCPVFYTHKQSIFVSILQYEKRCWIEYQSLIKHTYLPTRYSRRWVYIHFYRKIGYWILRPNYVAPYRGLQGAAAGNTGAKLFGAKPFSFLISALVRALHNTQHQQLYIPSKGQSNGQVSCLRTEVSRQGLKHTLCWSETPEIEFGALNCSARTLPHI